MSISAKQAAISFLASVACGSALALDVYSTPLPDINSPGFSSDADGAAYKGAATKAQPVASVVNGIEWWGFYSNPSSESPVDSFTLNLYAGAGTTPGALLASFSLGSGNRVATGNHPFGFYNQYSYSASFADYTLTGGPYFVSIVDSNPAADEWIWQKIGTLGGVGGALQTVGGAWTARSDANLAFRLTYTAPVSDALPVPEPETYAMMLAGLGLLGGMARRRQRFTDLRATVRQR